MPSFGTFSFAMLAWSAFFATSTLAASDNSTKVPLRIMALGASVSFGIGSTTGNSYRKDLEDLLVKDGDTVEYVGSEKHGDFSDNAVEAVPGFVIAQIAASASISVPKFKPNLVLIDSGTNNCNKGGTVPDAGANITNLINKIYEQSPGSTVILTTVLVNSVAKQDACRVNVNEQYTALASTMQAAGAKLVLVDMRGPGGPLVADLADGRHPNDAGYVKMANIWYGGIQEAISKGFITTPSAKSNSSSTSSSSKRPHGAKNSTSTSTIIMTSTTVPSDQASSTSNAAATAAMKSSGSRAIQPTFLAAMLVSFVLAMNWSG